MTTLIFYKVNNSKGFNRFTFDGEIGLISPVDFDAHRKMFDKLNELDQSEWELRPYSRDIIPALDDSDAFNDWDDDVDEAMGWNEDDHKEAAKFYGEEFGMTDDEFDKWIINYWCIAVQFTMDDIKEYFYN